MSRFPILYWPRSTKSDNEYQTARKVINTAIGEMPNVISGDLNVADIFANHENAVIYYPVFYGSTGWWGELLGGDAVVTEKLIISPECQLMVIESAKHSTKHKGNTTHQLFAAEIYPTSGFFKKMTSEIATVADMLATDAGTILALFAGRDKNRLVNILESTGNSYLGCIGRY
ncbi:MAG: hypothetical protein IKS08_01400 [Alphaproteobacteria bacterium]|nr:hypothetical protein [Alphaproteobacteria bacterium]